MNASMKALPILGVLHGLNVYHGKRYCFPSQNKLLTLLESRHDDKKSKPTINRHLRVIEDSKYVKRKRRIRRDKKLGMVFQSTLYTITKKGYLLLARFGVDVWAMIKKTAGELKKQAGQTKPKTSKKSPGVSEYFLPGSGLLEDVSKKPT